MDVGKSISDSTDWYSKYKSIKRKFKDMYALRIASVQDDMNIVMERTNEHRRVHAEAVADIREEAVEFRQMIDDAARMKHEIKRMQENIAQIKRSIRCRDSVLNILLEFKSLHVVLVEPGAYKVKCGPGDRIEFGLVKDTDIIYRPISISKNISLPSIMFSDFSMALSQLPKFCGQLDSAITDFITKRM
jgi:hypothetical protein